MQLTLTQRSLSSALDPVRRVVSRPGTIPILSNVLLVAEAATDDTPSTVRLTGTDLDREVTVSTGAEVVTPGETTVPAGLLLDIVRKLPSGAEVTLSVDDEGRQMTVASGRSKFRLQCLPAGDFPDAPRIPATHAFVLSHDAVRHVFGRTAFAVSTEETRYYLCGVFLHVPTETGLLTGVGACGHRLAIAEIPAPEGSAGMPGVIVPSGAVSELLRLVGKTDGEVRIALSDQGISVQNQNVELFSKLIDGTFPEYRRLVPSSNPERLTVDRRTLATAVERVATVNAEKGSRVKLALSSSEILLSAMAADAGSAIEAVDGSFTGQPFEIGFNSKYLTGILAEMQANEIEIALASPGEPALINGDAGVQIVLMPMRT